MGEVKCVWIIHATCVEGPLWIEAELSLLFLDIYGQMLHWYHEYKGVQRSWELE